MKVVPCHITSSSLCMCGYLVYVCGHQHGHVWRPEVDFEMVLNCFIIMLICVYACVSVCVYVSMCVGAHVCVFV